MFKRFYSHGDYFCSLLHALFSHIINLFANEIWYAVSTEMLWSATSNPNMGPDQEKKKSTLVDALKMFIIPD